MSYTQADRPWAEWIAWQLEAAGFETVLQAWDFAPGSDWVEEMDKAVKTSDRTVLVMSEDYLRSEFGKSEWREAFKRDPSGSLRKLLPVRIARCDVTGLLATRTYVDLVGLHPDAARDALIAAMRPAGERAKPDVEPSFPGTPPPRFPGPVRFGLPLRATYFRGREAELFALEQATAAGSRTLVTQAIAGLGGVGKTQLAAAYAHDGVDEFDIVAWVRAEDGGVEDLANLASVLGAAADDLKPAERAERAVRWLESCGERWLLVLDNLASPEQLAGCCPTHGNGQVIVTSRHRGFDEFATVLRVDVFEEETATSYLVERANRPYDRDAAATLAGALGGLPLALAHAGAYCAQGTSFSDYLELLEALPAAEMFDRSPETSYEQTVASTWQLSIEAAGESAHTILKTLSYLAPDNIPIGLLGATADPRARKALHDALNALDRYSLATVDTDRISVHRLLQKVVRESLRDWSAADTAFESVSSAFPEDVAIPATWAQCETLLPHVYAFVDATEAEFDPEKLVGLLHLAGGYLVAAGGGRRLDETADRELHLAEQRLGATHRRTLIGRSDVAYAHWNAGRHAEAIRVEEALLEDYVKLLRPDDPDALAARTNLALSYWSVGRIDEAIAHQEAVLELLEERGESSDALLVERNNLALSYYSAGRLAEAIELQEVLLGDSERVRGAEHPETLSVRSNLAGSYQKLGRRDEALDHLEAVLAARERTLGPEHPDTLLSCCRFAFARVHGEEREEAIGELESTLPKLERVLGAEHPHTQTTRRALADLRG